MQCLTRDDARHRSATVHLDTMDVHVDLTRAGDPAVEEYPVRAEFGLTLDEGETFVDVAGAVDRVLVDGAEHPHALDGERLHLTDLPTGRPLTLTVEARCRYSRTGEGLHRYVDPEDDRVYLYTQFEPNDAHRAWPCLDQPDLKARWTFHVTAPESWVVTSNGVATRSDLGGGLARHDFTTTPPLSSYITALVAGEWALVEGGTWTGRAASHTDDAPDAAPASALLPDGDVTLDLRLLCRRALAAHMDSDDILAVTRAGLDFYHATYGTTFPWGSYDQVFVPEYNLGAMENPGCVTFNERYLSRDTPTFAERQKRANTILHEMCHMWFGDLATPAWWDDLWLKESFADNQGTLVAAEATPYSGEWASFAVARKAWAYEQDQYPTTHPIVADIPDVDAAKTNFDGITYAKGAAVLKQLVAWVGRDAFFAGVRRYFHRHAFGATGLADLLSALEDASGLDLAAWERAWLHTTGPSVLAATWTEDGAGAVRDFTLTQSAADGAERVIRPHELLVTTWALRDGALTRTHSFPVRIDGESAPIDPEGALIAEGAAADLDLVVVNDADLTYAVARLDERSTRTALAALSTCPDPLTRAVVWASLWNAVRDGITPAADVVRAILTHGAAEGEDAVLDRLLTLVRLSLARFVPAGERDALRHEVLAACEERLAVEERADRRRAWTHLLLDVFADLEVSERVCVERVRELAEGLGEAGSLGEEVTWHARSALAGRGLVTRGELDDWLAAAPTGEATVHHRRSLAGLPEAAVRERMWREVLDGTLSNEMMSATLAGLAASSWPGDELDAAFFDTVGEFWDGHTIGMGIRFVRGAFPRHCDAGSARTHAIAEACRGWLDARPDAPAALRRLLVEHLDDLERAVRVQEAASR